MSTPDDAPAEPLSAPVKEAPRLPTEGVTEPANNEDKKEDNAAAAIDPEPPKGPSTESTTAIESGEVVTEANLHEQPPRGAVTNDVVKEKADIEPLLEKSSDAPSQTHKIQTNMEISTPEAEPAEEPAGEKPSEPLGHDFGEKNAASEAEKSSDTMEIDNQKSDTAVVDTAAEDSTASKELPYSTRGRSTDKEAKSGETFSARETLEEIGRVKDASPASLGVSFLESLGEEERRTRTRFVPEVDGMHVLRKQEIRDDLSLARSLVSSSGVMSLKKSKGKKIDAMDVDDDGCSPSEDGSTEIARPVTKTLELPTRDIVVPSNAFVAPPGGASGDDGQSTSISSHKTENGVKSPLLVDSVTAFNPPRPPESIGAKKKHRMLRWERRPEDVEVDLNNYRKTVQRTRQELHKAEAEYSRLETIDAHLRWNFLNHLNLMNEEFTRLNEETGSVQQECVKAADLLTSRTRSRGASKGTCVMKDILNVLKTKGLENAESMETALSPVVTNSVLAPGIGGLLLSVFGDWNRKTTINQKDPASGWTVPGEKIKTPYGEGIVLQVLPPKRVADTSDKNQNGDDTNDMATDKSVTCKKDISRKSSDKAEDIERDFSCDYLKPRVSVKLPFGVGFFGLDVIQPLENPCLFSDSQLASRWQNMVKTAIGVGGTIDLEGMNFNAKQKPQEIDGIGDGGIDETSQVEVDDSGPSPASEAGVHGDRVQGDEDERFMPFGAGLLPTATGRGNLLEQISITDIEEAMDKALYQGGGVLGKTSNQGVTEEFRRWEDEEQEYLTLQGDVLQLRNALVRQKRIRLLNERTNAATADRYNRAAELVAEMRSDLKSLKHRLEEELKELGLDEPVTEQILSSFYLGQDSPVDVGGASPLKRSRRSMSQVEGDAEGPAYGSDDRESGTDDVSGDDMDGPRAKKLRPNQ